MSTLPPGRPAPDHGQKPANANTGTSPVRLFHGPDPAARHAHSSGHPYPPLPGGRRESAPSLGWRRDPASPGTRIPAPPPNGADPRPDRAWRFDRARPHPSSPPKRPSSARPKRDFTRTEASAAAPLVTAPPLPPPLSALAQYSLTSSGPSSMPYNEVFENSLMKIILDQPAPPSTPPSQSPRSAARISGTAPSTGADPHQLWLPPALPRAPATPLVPLADPRRIHSHPLLPAGIRLTHPAGNLLGGDGPEPADRARLSREFAARHGLASREQWDAQIRRATAALVESVYRRAQARDRAIEQNRRIDKEMMALVRAREREIAELESGAPARKRRKGEAAS